MQNPKRHPFVPGQLLAQTGIQKIADLNNFAVACIDANEFRKALNTLALSIHFTRLQLDHIGSPNGQEYVAYPRLSSQACYAANHEEAPLPSLTGSLHTRIPNSDVPCRDVNGQLFHFSSERKYQHPFRAFHEMDRYTMSNDSTTFMHTHESHATLTIQLAAIVIFNCALCHDLLAASEITSAHTRKALRDKAIALYEKVVNLYSALNSDSCVEANDTTNSVDHSSSDGLRRPGIVGAQQDMIVMAAVNNLVQLHQESSHERYNCSQLMMALFQEIEWTDYGSQEIQSQVNTQARVFVSNAAMPSNMELEISAAAA